MSSSSPTVMLPPGFCAAAASANMPIMPATAWRGRCRAERSRFPWQLPPGPRRRSPGSSGPCAFGGVLRVDGGRDPRARRDTGPDPAGMHDRDADAGVLELVPQRLGKAADRELACRIGGLAGGRDDAEDAREV